jgi:hypothetical protein
MRFFCLGGNLHVDASNQSPHKKSLSLSQNAALGQGKKQEAYAAVEVEHS